ncbi:MAG: HK97-gp10 family putative phage morphogenesis protein [Cetobacterium sp.]
MAVRIKGKLSNLKDKINKQIKVSGGVHIGFNPNSIYPNGTPVELVALFLEFGTKNMPPRPFMRNTIRKNKKKWSNLLRNSKNFDIVGKQIINDIKTSIINGNFEPLKPSTIKKKGNSYPLIDTGTLYDSLIYKKIPSKEK